MPGGGDADGTVPGAGTSRADLFSVSVSGASWQGPSSRLRSVRRLEAAVVAVPVLAAVVIAGVAAGSAVFAVVGSVVVVLAAGVAYGFMARRIGAWGYAERDDDLLVRRGVMFRRLSIIPYGRMQYVDVTSGPFERSFGLSTVRMYTAAAASDARIPGLPADEAARLRDNLTRLGEARAAGL
jgi:uncharacterized protein